MKVFVSHGTHDTWIARQLARCIGDAGAGTFVDTYDLAVGDRFETEIHEALSSCDELVALITPFAIDRAWVHQEVGAMWHQRKRVSVILHGLSVKDVESGSAPDIGLLRLRRLIALNDFDAYLSDLRKRCSRVG